MRNVKVRGKILLSFGVTILFIIIMVVVVLLSNLQTSSDLKLEQNENALLGLNNEYVLSYWKARVAAAPLYTSLDPKAHDETVKYIEMAYATLETMKSNLGSNPALAKYSEDILLIEDDMTQWKLAIDKVESSNRNLERAILDSRVQQVNLRQAADSTYRNQQDIWQREAYEETSPDDRFRRAGRLDETVVFMREIEEIVSAGEYIFGTRDASSKESFIASMDSITADLQENGDVARNQATQDTAYYTIEVLNRYREAFDVFERINAGSFADIAEAQRLGEVATAAVAILSDKLDASTGQSIRDTVDNNNFSFILSVIIAIISILASTVVAFIVSGSISKPLVPLAAFMHKAGTTGEIVITDVDAEIIRKYSGNGDEIGRCIAGAASLMGHITNVANELETISDGDLTTDIKLLSDCDTMGKSLKLMVESLNNMFGNIHTSTAQVSTGSRQVANGAQTLAQGSTSQDESIRELSVAIAEIAQKTKTNAETAEKAASLATKIISNAEKGSMQMDEMIAAVQDINQASQGISKVIKVIDDIAFQTNILALNAAVEAARAGQHGKGFAVVAEEVRNLASKSAEAAKETGSMIEESIEKADLGARIAHETSTSFMEIVSGINENNMLITEIANASEEQTMDIEKINNSVEQVAQVVRLNSATAQESADASKEMSSQSNMLQDLIARFRLKNI